MSSDTKLNIAAALQAFNTGNLTSNSIALFDTLGYNTARKSPFSNTTYNTFKESFIDSHSRFSEEKALVKEWKYVDLLFQLSTEEMQQHESLFKPSVERNDPASYVFFAIELTKNNYTRNQLAQIAREINKPFPMHVFVIFKYGNHLTLSLIDRRAHKKIIEKDVIEKVTHVYNINIDKPHAAHIQILFSFSINAIKAEAPKKKIESFKDLQNGWRKVISTDILNKQFYLDYQHLSVKLIHAIYPKQVKNKLAAHQGVLNLLNRIMFIYFVQKKEWIMKDENFINHFWKAYLNTKVKDKFHADWLNSIFFSAFNGVAYKDPKAIKALPEPYKTEIINFPYLNGGLFAFSDDYDNFTLNDDSFHDIFNFFENYIFTIAEDTPYDVNLEINPELLGKMYEGMINATDLDDVDAENGIIYTERPEINFMTRRSFVEVLDKKLNGTVSREFLYHFIFDTPEQKKEIVKRYKANTSKLREAVSSITACDPSCGSGSMILGVIQLQMELIRVLDAHDNKAHTPKDDFNIKKQLISECIYGVDIKEWAVRIAELRLWLYMIAEAEFTREELTKTPLLPNLDFKLRKGNSLLQKFGNLDFTIDDLLKNRNKTTGAARKLNEFIKKKKAFIQNQSDSKTTYKRLKEEEFAVFIQFIDELIIEADIKLKNLAKRGKQEKLFAEPQQTEMEVDDEEKQNLKNDIEALKKLKATIKKENRLPFSYDIDFMEVFLTNDNPGFDLMIGNPPYVKEAQILPPEDGEYLEYLLLPENKKEKSEANENYKNELNGKIYKTFPFLSTTLRTELNGKAETLNVYGKRIPGKSDLYAYFQLICPSYLNSKGTFCFIISNSWLDVGFGAFIQQFLLKHTNIHAFYDCNVRSFDAKVNTIIYIHSALNNHEEKRESFYKTLKPNKNPVRFIMNKIDFIQAAYAPLLLEQENCREDNFKDIFRVIIRNQSELFELGYENTSLSYEGEKWYGVFFKAPEIYHTLNARKEFKPLNEFGKIKLGITSCQDDFFYVDKEIITKYKIEEEYLFPILTSPQESKRITISPNLLPYKVILCETEFDKLKARGVKNYIQYGESKKVDKVTCLKSRKTWYNLGQPEKSNIAIPYSYGQSFKTFFSKSPMICNKRVVQFIPNEKNSTPSFICFMNSSLWFLFLESYGSSNLGEGALVFNTENFRRLKAIDIKIDEKKFAIIKDAIFKREILDIFSELGFNGNENIREQQPNPLPDRKELDNIIFDELGLTQAERNEVYWSVAELVKQRIDKAASR